MILLLISGSDEINQNISSNVKPLGYSTVVYGNVLKAMDNIEEIDPDLIIICARDFPKHWKLVTQYIRNMLSKNECPIILLTGKKFCQNEKAKADHLGINACFPAHSGNPALLLAEYLRVDDHEDKVCENIEKTKQDFNFVFSVPDCIPLVTGKVKEITSNSLVFLPDYSDILDKLEINMELNSCSLRAGNVILSPVCRLVEKKDYLSMEFVSFLRGEKEILENSLAFS